MKINIDSLERLNLLTREGAQTASTVLSDRTGAESVVEVTKVILVDERDISADVEASGTDFVHFDLSGRLSGDALVAYDGGRASERFPDDATALVDEMMHGFVETWESELEAELGLSDPVHRTEPEPETFRVASDGPETNSLLVFLSKIAWSTGAGGLDIYFVPDRESLPKVVTAEDDDTDTLEIEGESDSMSFGDDDGEFGGTPSFMDDEEEDTPTYSLDKLFIFNDLTREGTEAAAQRVSTMTGVETTADVTGISFTPIEDISSLIKDDTYVGTTVEFDGVPSGYLVILFDVDSAKTIAELLLPTDDPDDGFTEMHRSAIEELGNIMTSGFIDGWANVLQTSVEHTPPELVDDLEMPLLEIVTQQLGPFQTHAFTIDSTMYNDEVAFDCQIHALPNESELEAALDELLVERRNETKADPDELF
jgi:chemotaxis protein CheY-P-specific phosphatase CheC